MGGLDGELGAYRQARKYYEEYEEASTIDERIGQLSEPPFHENTKVLRGLIGSSAVYVDEDRKTTIEFRSPVERIRFKASHVDEMMAEFVESGEWPS